MLAEAEAGSTAHRWAEDRRFLTRCQGLPRRERCPPERNTLERVHRRGHRWPPDSGPPHQPRRGRSVANSPAGTLAPKSPATPAIPMPKRPAGTLYRGREGMWSWVLHRITGVAIFFFLLVHILDTALVRVSPEAYNAVIGTYKTPIMGLGEIALVAAIGLHALNGLRIILIDFSELRHPSPEGDVLDRHRAVDRAARGLRSAPAHAHLRGCVMTTETVEAPRSRRARRAAASTGRSGAGSTCAPRASCSSCSSSVTCS